MAEITEAGITQRIATMQRALVLVMGQTEGPNEAIEIIVQLLYTCALAFDIEPRELLTMVTALCESDEAESADERAGAKREAKNLAHLALKRSRELKTIVARVTTTNAPSKPDEARTQSIPIEPVTWCERCGGAGTIYEGDDTTLRPCPTCHKAGAQ